MARLAEGSRAPAFKLAQADGGSVSLADFRGQKLVLYFYPRADTPGCTREAMDFSRLRPKFMAVGTGILGVSADPAAALGKFAAKHRLTVALATDPGHEMLAAYDAWGEKSMYGRKFLGVIRKTFLIDGKGRIVRIWPKVSVPNHAEDVLAAARELP